jgi:small subunit ribosomal protein S16
MLKIKLVRFGKKDQPHYRIVVQEARTKRDGQYTALLGHYAPAQQPKLLEVNMDEYKEWVAKGAQPTETVAALAKRFATGTPFPPKKKTPSKKQVEKQKQAEEAAKAPVVEEAPAVEEAPVVEETASEEAPIAEETTTPTE